MNKFLRFNLVLGTNIFFTVLEIPSHTKPREVE